MNPPVFQLIKKLSGPEKRHFKLFARTYQKTEESAMIQLFDFLDKADAYNESALQAAFAQASFRNQLPVIKNQLYHKILDVLRTFHKKRSFGLYFSERLDKIELLFGMQLFEPCRKLILRTKQKASKMELPNRQLELIGWEMRIARMMPGRNMKTTLSELVAEEHRALHHIAAESRLRQLHNEVYTLFVQRAYLRDEAVQNALTELMEDPLLAGNADLAFDARVIFHYIHLYQSLLVGHSEKSVSEYRAMAVLWEAYPDRIRFEPDRYFRTLNGYLDISCQARIFHKTGALIEKIQKLLNGSERLRARYEYRANAVILRYYLNTGNYLEGEKWAVTIQRDLQAKKGKIPVTLEISLWYNLAILYFILARFSDCLNCLNQILNQTQDQSREDLRIGTRTLSMIVHYELGNWELTHSIVRSLTRFIGQQSVAYTFESMVGKFLKKLINIEHQGSPEPLFREMQTALAAIEEGAEIPLESEVKAWLEARISGQSIVEVLLASIS